MATQIKTVLPPTYKIERAAETLGDVMPYGIKAVYLIGHGGQRDWEGGVGRIFREYLEDMIPIFVPQDDNKKPGGYRPLQKSPRSLRVRGATSALIFDTSSKEFTSIDGTDVPTSSSQSGAWIDLLRHANYLEIPQFFSLLTSDFSGNSTISIEPMYEKYYGPRKFVELNLVSLKVAASQLRNQSPYERFRERLTTGKIVPTRLRRYEKFLIRSEAWSNEVPLEEVVIPNLKLIVEPSISEPDGYTVLPTLAEVLKRG